MSKTHPWPQAFSLPREADTKECEHLIQHTVGGGEGAGGEGRTILGETGEGKKVHKSNGTFEQVSKGLRDVYRGAMEETAQKPHKSEGDNTEALGCGASNERES